jgi:hypothetical protein
MQDKQGSSHHLTVSGQVVNPYKSDELSLPGIEDKKYHKKHHDIISEV